MRRQTFLPLLAALLAPPLLAQSATAPAPEDNLPAKAAFARLQALAGEWEGTTIRKDGPAARVRWEAISNKTALMETLFPGTDHEMRSVYHLDGNDLVMTHYCAMGNQPRMKLDTSRSTASQLVFDFAGGTNMDPAKDAHIHSGRIVLVDDDHLEAEWTVYKEAEPTGANRFFLRRKK